MIDEHRDQIWDKQESSWKFRNLERKCFLELLLKQKGAILEIGPGYGRVLRSIENNGQSIIGLEISKKLYSQLKEEGFNVKHGDALKMPFESETFDCVVGEEVIEHITEQKKLIEEVSRVLKPEGCTVFTTPNKWVYRMLMYISNFINGIWSWKLFLNPTPGHVAELTFRKANKLFNDKFSKVNIIPLNPYIADKVLKKSPFLAIGFIIIAEYKIE